MYVPLRTLTIKNKPQHVDEELVGQDVQLLDSLTLNIDIASAPTKVGNSSPPDSCTYGLYSRLDASQQLG